MNEVDAGCDRRRRCLLRAIFCKTIFCKAIFCKTISVKQISVSFHEVLHQARRGRVSKFK